MFSRGPLYWLPHERERREVVFSDATLVHLGERPSQTRDLIAAVLAQDPRPAYCRALEDDDRTYGVAVDQFDIGFHVQGGTIRVESIRLRR